MCVYGGGEGAQRMRARAADELGVLLQASWALGARDWEDVGAPRVHPRERHLPRRNALTKGELLQRHACLKQTSPRKARS